MGWQEYDRISAWPELSTPIALRTDAFAEPLPSLSTHGRAREIVITCADQVTETNGTRHDPIPSNQLKLEGCGDTTVGSTWAHTEWLVHPGETSFPATGCSAVGRGLAGSEVLGLPRVASTRWMNATDEAHRPHNGLDLRPRGFDLPHAKRIIRVLVVFLVGPTTRRGDVGAMQARPRAACQRSDDRRPSLDV